MSWSLFGGSVKPQFDEVNEQKFGIHGSNEKALLKTRLAMDEAKDVIVKEYLKYRYSQLIMANSLLYVEKEQDELLAEYKDINQGTDAENISAFFLEVSGVGSVLSDPFEIMKANAWTRWANGKPLPTNLPYL